MRENCFFRYPVLFCFLILLLISNGCALHSNQGKISPTEERLITRVNQQMQAQLDDEWDLGYDFLSSKFKSQVTRKKFNRYPREIEILKYRIEKVVINPDLKTATVAIRSDFAFRGYKFTNALETHRWIFEQGDWYNETDSLKSLFAPPKELFNN